MNSAVLYWFWDINHRQILLKTTSQTIDDTFDTVNESKYALNNERYYQHMRIDGELLRILVDQREFNQKLCWNAGLKNNLTNTLIYCNISRKPNVIFGYFKETMTSLNTHLLMGL